MWLATKRKEEGVYVRYEEWMREKVEVGTVLWVSLSVSSRERSPRSDSSLLPCTALDPWRFWPCDEEGFLGCQHHCSSLCSELVYRKWFLLYLSAGEYWIFPLFKYCRSQKTSHLYILERSNGHFKRRRKHYCVFLTLDILKSRLAFLPFYIYSRLHCLHLHLAVDLEMGKIWMTFPAFTLRSSYG